MINQQLVSFTFQLQATQVFDTVKHIWRGNSSEKKIYQRLTAVAMDRIFK